MNNGNLEFIDEIMTHTTKEIKNISHDVRVKESVNRLAVKGVLENLRSALDYMAQDVFNYVVQKKGLQSNKKKIYFPYGRDKEKFTSSVKNNFLHLDELPDLFSILESSQPYMLHDSWLPQLCDLVNEVKHRNLDVVTPKTNTVISMGNFIHLENCSGVYVHDNYINGRRADDIYVDHSGNVKITPHLGITEVIRDKHFFLNGVTLEIVSFLENCHYQIDRLKVSVYHYIEHN